MHKAGAVWEHVPPPIEGANLHEGELSTQFPRARDRAVGEELPARQPRRQAPYRVPVRQGDYYSFTAFRVVWLRFSLAL